MSLAEHFTLIVMINVRINQINITIVPMDDEYDALHKLAIQWVIKLDNMPNYSRIFLSQILNVGNQKF